MNNAEQKLEHLKTDLLIPYARNSRTHSENQIQQITSSIKEFGFTNPILIDANNGIIAGHGRVMAAQLMGIESVPCIRLAHLTDAQKRAYIIADNQLALNSGWDEDLLRAELLDLQGIEFDMDLLGFDDDELANYMFEPTEAQADENQILPEPVDPITQAGDIYLLGKHRIICGDSTDAIIVEKLLNGAKPHLMVTDPPYGVEYDASWRSIIHSNDGTINDLAIGKVLNDDRSDWREAWELFPGDVAYIWHGSTHTTKVSDSLKACQFELRSLIVWSKSSLVISRGDYHNQFEPCWYAVRKGKTGHWTGSRKKTTLWRHIDDLLRPGEEVFYKRDGTESIHVISGDESTIWEIPKNMKSETGHSTQKPVECMRRPIQNNSRRGDSIYEPFSGSGTTIIAAEQTGRLCYAVELNPAYVDMAIIRWQNFTGKKATLEITGQTFDELAEAVDNG